MTIVGYLLTLIAVLIEEFKWEIGTYRRTSVAVVEIDSRGLSTDAVSTRSAMGGGMSLWQRRTCL